MLLVWSALVAFVLVEISGEKLSFLYELSPENYRSTFSSSTLNTLDFIELGDVSLFAGLSRN